MDVPAALEAAFPPSAEILLNCARRHVDDQMLMDIAEADYGYMADEMLALLRPIRDQGVIPAPMHFQLKEVLSLTRWCNPEKPNAPPFKPGPTGRRGHQSRLFVCAVILRASAEFANRHMDPGGDDSTLAQCLFSAKVLGEGMNEAVARFLTWYMPDMWSCSDPVLFALGLLILTVRLRSGRSAEHLVEEAADWVLSEESAYRRRNRWDPADPAPAPFGVQSGFWQPLAAELKAEAAAIGSTELRTKLELCALLLELA